MIESIDSVELATRVARVARETGRGPYSVYVQVNVDSDPAKGGFEPETLSRHLDEILELDGVDVRGLMTVGRQVDRPEDARLTFVRLRELSERLRRLDGRVGTELSMGMSDDFEVGVEEGATIVRLGRVIFGQRPTA